MSLLVGSDPELMLKNGGNLVSALRVHPARKYNPHPLASGGKILADNVNLELNPVPGASARDFSFNIAIVLRETAHILPDLEMVAQASAVFPEQEMNDPEAHMFGCEPELDAWRREMVPPPQVEWGNYLRSCGGHIHVGCKEAEKDPLRMIQMMDQYVGVPLVLMDHDETSERRHNLYGGAGRYRITSYGVEYRSPSNYWMRSEHLAEIVWLLTSYAVQDISRGVSADAMDVVNNRNVPLAWEVFNRLSDRIPRLLVEDIRYYANNPMGDNVLEMWEIR